MLLQPFSFLCYPANWYSKLMVPKLLGLWPLPASDLSVDMSCEQSFFFLILLHLFGTSCGVLTPRLGTTILSRSECSNEMSNKASKWLHLTGKMGFYYRLCSVSTEKQNRNYLYTSTSVRDKDQPSAVATTHVFIRNTSEDALTWGLPCESLANGHTSPTRPEASYQSQRYCNHTHKIY